MQTLYYFQVSLCHETVDVLCDHILPFILSDNVHSPCKVTIGEAIILSISWAPHILCNAGLHPRRPPDCPAEVPSRYSGPPEAD